MEFNQQSRNRNSIISLQNSEVKLAHTLLKTPCFISPNYYSETNIRTLEAIDKPSIFALMTKDNIDLLIIGTGHHGALLHPKQQIALQQMGVSTESMNSQAACRSFNLLLSDARLVGLLLL